MRSMIYRFGKGGVMCLRGNGERFDLFDVTWERVGEGVLFSIMYGRIEIFVIRF